MLALMSALCTFGADKRRGDSQRNDRSEPIVPLDGWFSIRRVGRVPDFLCGCERNLQ